MYHRAILKDWTITPLSSGLVCVGKIYGDKKKQFKDGTVIRTSVIVREWGEDGNNFIQTLNDTYILKGNETNA